MKLPAGIASAPVVLVRGSDPVLVRDAVVDIDRLLVGDNERDFCVEDLSFARLVTEGGSVDLGRVVDAAHTPAMLADRRIVVARGLAVLTKRDDVAALLDYLADPLPTSTVVLVWDKPDDSQRKTGAPPKALLEAVDAAGGVVVVTDPPSGKQLAGWLDDQLAGQPFTLDAGARQRLVESIGDAPDRVVGVLTTLRGVFAGGGRLSADDIEPYLGQAGDVTPWTLTDAIDGGDVAGAVTAAQRMMAGGDRHPLVVLATLSGHVGALLGLSGAEVAGKDDAGRILGIHPFRASKALGQARRLGSERVAEFVDLVAAADRDVRGASTWDPQLVVEVLVARLASRSTTSGARRR